MTATRPAWRVLLWPTAGAAVLLAILLALGAWQVHRLAWKNAWVAQLRAAEATPPAPLPAVVEDPAALAFRRFVVTGTYRHDLSAVLGVSERAHRLGTFLVTPLIRAQGDPVWVVRGWVPYEAPRAVPDPAGEVTVTGFLMLPEQRGWFTPDDKPGERRFWAFQPGRMAEAVGLARAAPFAIAAIGPGEEPPIPLRRPPMPRNNHLGYAITWFGLAFALVAFWIVWARRLLRDERAST